MSVVATAAPPLPLDGGTTRSDAFTATSSSSLTPISPSTSSSATTSQTPAVPDSAPRSTPNAPAPGAPSSAPAAAAAGVPPPHPAYSAVARPAYFFPLNNNPKKSQESEPEPIPDDLIVLPEDDPAASAGIPVFKPTYEEFKDFDVYMERVAPWGQRSSIVKIIPPKEWVENHSHKLIDRRAMSELEIRSPIEQNMLGKNGVFVQQNIERNRNRPLSMKEWFNKCNHPDFKTPNPKQGDRTVDRDSRDAKIWQRETAAAIKAERAAKREAALRRKEEREAKKAEEAQAAEKAKADSSSFQTPPASQSGDDDVPGLENSSHTSQSDGEPLATPESHSMVVDESTPSPPKESPLDPFYETVDWKKDWLPTGATQDDFTVAGCSNLERKFWKTIGITRSSWYGADLAGSLFADPSTPWNVATLPNLLQRLKGKLPGVNTPYLYFGMWRAAFSWHVEDMDLFSINYIHFGAPKFWYAVPQIDAERFENVTRSYFPNDANVCDQFMRHKSCTLSPTKLAQEGIRVNKLVQLQNEFVITFPRGYHAGFNMGFNCAESVNFALPYWLDIGRKAKACTCVNYSVRIDVDRLLQSPSPEEEQVEEEGEDGVSPHPRPRKRKSAEGSTPRQPRARKRRTEPLPEEPVVKEEATPPPPPRIPIIKLRLPKLSVDLSSKDDKPRSIISRERPKPPCILCPSLATEDLAPVYQPSEAIRALSMTPGVMAHVSCAIAVPEAYTEDVETGDVDGRTVTYIKGLDAVGKDRWKLKCSSCVDQRSAKTGTKIQCTKGKCTRAYHVPCARDNEMVHYWAGDRIGADGTPTFAVELLCSTHNPAVVEMKKRKAREELRAKLLALDSGATIKVRLNGGSHEAMLVQVIDETTKVVVETADGIRHQLAWSAVDFQARQPRMMENEYAGPPKRSRKEQQPPTAVHQGVIVSQSSMMPPPQVMHQHQITTYRPPSSGDGYYPSGPGGPTATSVVLVDSRTERMPPPHFSRHQPPPSPFGHYGPGPGGYGPGPTVEQHPRPFPPPMNALPRLPMPSAGRMMPAAYASRPAIFSPPVQQHHHHMTHSPMGHQAPPVPNGSASWNNGNPQRNQGSPAAPPPPSLPPNAPSGVGKIDLGLDRMQSLMAGLPRVTVPAVHLAGTNGKGSVSALLESCFREAGFRTARYNSPHLLEARDAVRINGLPPSREIYSDALAQVERVAKERSLEPTTFEVATAAFFYVAQTVQPPVDVMIVECGMGGLRDATNVMPHDIILASGLTSVGLDHTDRLGNTIGEITREKASIVVPHGVLVAAPNLNPEALAMAQRVVEERKAHFVRAGASGVTAPPGGVTLVPFNPPSAVQVRTPLQGTVAKVLDTALSLGGPHQLDNLSLALTLLDVMRHDQRARLIQPKLTAITEDRLRDGVAAARWEGRCSWLTWRDGDTVIPMLCDGAHNADSANTLRRYIDSLGVLPADRARTFVISLSANPGKTPSSVLSPLLRPGDRVALVDFTCPVEGMPWIRPADRAAVGAAAHALVGGGGEVRDIPGTGPPAIADALRWAVSDWAARGPGLVVVAGSLYLVADAYRLIGASSTPPPAPR